MPFYIDDDGNTGDISEKVQSIDSKNIDMEKLTNIRLEKPIITREEFDKEISISGFTFEENQRLFDNLDRDIETFTQFQYIEVMKRITGYLVPRQKFYLIRKFERANVFIQYKFRDYNHKILDNNYDNYMKAKLDPNAPIFAGNNSKIAEMAAQERERYNSMVEGYETARKLADVSSTHVKQDSRNHNMINAKSKNLIVEYQNGEIVKYDSGLEDIRMNSYKAHLNQLNNAKVSDSNYYDIDEDPEWS